MKSDRAGETVAHGYLGRRRIACCRRPTDRYEDQIERSTVLTPGIAGQPDCDRAILRPAVSLGIQMRRL